MVTTAPSATPAMAFYHCDGLAAAWEHAARFSGPQGRIATLPDIIAARLASKPGTPAWESYFTTTSAEYVGIGKEGRKVILVAHGIGPMSTLDGIEAAYSHESESRNHKRRGGRISRKEFLKLERGDYGDVISVDFQRYVARYEYPFSNHHLRLSAALADPLLKARLGPEAEAYLHAHADYARQWHLEKAGFKPDGTNTGLGTGNSRLHHADAQPGSDPLLIAVSDASNCSYQYRVTERGEALAHLLSIGQLVHLQHGMHERPVCEVSAHECWNGVRLVGVSGLSAPQEIRQGPENLYGLILENWERLAGYAGSGTPQPMSTLMEGEGGQWFTQHPKDGERMDTQEPEFPVLSVETVGNPVTLTTTVGGFHGFFKYGIHEVAALAPAGANAYAVASEVEIVWTGGNPTHHTCLLQFYRAEIDASRRLPRCDDIKDDYDLLMSLAGG